MRQLTTKQKQYIDKLIKEYKAADRQLITCEDLDNDQWEKLEQMNNTEILWQEVNRYIHDKNMEVQYGR